MTWSNRAPVKSASIKPMPSPLVRVQTVFTSLVPRKQMPDKSTAPTFCRDRSPPSITIIWPTGAALRSAATAANVRNFRPSIAGGKTEPVPSTSPAPKRQLRATGGAVLGAGMITTLVGEATCAIKAIAETNDISISPQHAAIEPRFAWRMSCTFIFKILVENYQFGAPDIYSYGSQF